MKGRMLLGAKRTDILAWQGTTVLLDEAAARLRAALTQFTAAEQRAAAEAIRGHVAALVHEEEHFARQVAALLAELQRQALPVELLALHRRLEEVLVEHYRRRGAVLVLHRVCSSCREILFRRLLELAEQEVHQAGLVAPERWSALALGSHGRREDVPGGELDWLLVWSECSSADEHYFHALAEAAGRLLAAAGLVSGRGGADPRLALWHGCRDTWRERLEILGPEYLPLLAELRPLAGDAALAAELVRMVGSGLQRQPSLVAEAGRQAGSAPVAVGFLGRLRAETSGEFRGWVDLEQYGILPLVNAVRLLAIRYGIAETGTVGRILRLQADGRLGVELAERLLRTWHDLQELALQGMLDGTALRGLLDPGKLSDAEDERLRNGIEIVVNLQRLVYQTFCEER